MAKRKSKKAAVACPIVKPGRFFFPIELSKNQCDKLPIEPETKPLGCGFFGCAYEKTGSSDRVIKITRDREDVAAMLKVKGKGLTPKLYSVSELRLKKPLKPNPAGIKEWQESGKRKRIQLAPNVDWALKRGGKQRAFVLDVERVNPLTPQQRQFIPLVNDLQYFAIDRRCPPGKKCKPRQIVFPGAEANAGALCQLVYKGSTAKQCSKFVAEGIRIKKGLVENGIIWHDAHANNWGVTKSGKIVALDIGLTSLPLKKKLKVLAGLGMLPVR